MSGLLFGLRNDILNLMKKVVVDKEKCIGCGSCAAVAPKSFKMGDDGKARVLEPIGDAEETVKEAIEGCPVEAISWGN